MKRIVFITLLIMFSIKVFSQYDTAVYYNKLNKVVKSTDAAAYYYDNTIKTDDNNFKTEGHYLNNSRWILMSNSFVHKLSDTTYLMYNILYNTREKDTIIRLFKPKDNGYLIKDFKRYRLVATGMSKAVFPLIRESKWTYFNLGTGKKNKESVYKDNEEISNKNWDDNGKEIPSDVFTLADSIPQYNGGLSELQKFFQKNIKYPQDAKEKGIKGNVLVTIIVMEDGSVKDVQIFKGITLSLNDEAIRVARLTDKKWKPATINGKAVRFKYNIPVMFSLQ